jgi:hypothetical protein
VLELNLDALSDADARDRERARCAPHCDLSKLHGIPVLLKDNVAADGMETTAGELEGICFCQYSGVRGFFMHIRGVWRVELRVIVYVLFLYYVSFCRAPPLKLHTSAVKDEKPSGCVQSSIGYEGELHIFHDTLTSYIVALWHSPERRHVVTRSSGNDGKKGSVLKQH